MSSFVVSEALAVGLKEGLKIGIVGYVCYSYLALTGRAILMRGYVAGVALSIALSLTPLAAPQTLVIDGFLDRWNATCLAVIMLASAFGLFQTSGFRLIPGRVLSALGSGSRFVAVCAHALVFLVTFLFFAPDGIGTVFYLRGVAFVQERALATYGSALAGLAISASATYILFRFVRPAWVGSFFRTPHLLLFLAIVKLLAGGVKGVTELSLIPSVQRGFMKFSHDFIHQLFVLLMVPDHPLLRTTVWNFIGIVFGPNLSSLVSLAILLVFPLLFVYHSLSEPLGAPEAQTGAERRRIMSGILSDRRRKAVPVLLFIGFILIGWFAKSEESVSKLYLPAAKPVVADKGTILIPVNDPTMDLRDGMLHKFALLEDGEEIRLIVIMRSGGTLAVCLDACEICPPEGYGQRDDHVVCVYCNTPIPVDTLGKPGGCNPVPLSAAVDDRFIRVELAEVLKKWEFVKSGKGRKGLE